MAKAKKEENLEIEDVINSDITASEEISRAEKVARETGLLLDQIQDEIQKGYRSIKYNDKYYKIFYPSVKDDSEIVRFKNKLTSQLIKEKSLMLKGEILKDLKERGVWDSERDRQEKVLQDRINAVYKDLIMEKTAEEQNEERLQELREEKMSIELELLLLSGQKNDLLGTSLESFVESEVMKMKLVLCAKTDEEVRIWNSLEEFENTSDKALANTLLNEALYFWAGFNQALFDLALG